MDNKRKHNTDARSERKWYQERRNALTPGLALWKILRTLLVFLTSFIILCGLVVTSFRTVESYFFAPMDPDDETLIDFSIDSGTSLSSVARRLEAEGLVRNGTVFRYYADFRGLGQRIQSGHYSFSRSESANEILTGLVSGDGLPATMRITVIPGWTIEDTAVYLQGTGLLKDTEAF